MYLACVLMRIVNTLKGALAWIAVTSLALVIALVIAIVTGNWLDFGILALILGALVVTAIIAAIVIDLITCAVSPPPAGGGGGPGAGAGGLTAAVDCQTARDWLAAARTRVAQLQAELDAQGAKVRAAQDALANARIALTAATTGLAASFFFPWAVPAAAAAFAAATYAVTRAAQSLEAETRALLQLADQLGRAQAEVSADEAMVASACSTTVVPATPVAGITLGALRLVSGAHPPRSPAGTAGLA